MLPKKILAILGPQLFAWTAPLVDDPKTNCAALRGQILMRFGLKSANISNICEDRMPPNFQIGIFKSPYLTENFKMWSI